MRFLVRHLPLTLPSPAMGEGFGEGALLVVAAD
jgi:hypothetical protein